MRMKMLGASGKKWADVGGLCTVRSKAASIDRNIECLLEIPVPLTASQILLSSSALCPFYPTYRHLSITIFLDCCYALNRRLNEKLVILTAANLVVTGTVTMWKEATLNLIDRLRYIEADWYSDVSLWVKRKSRVINFRLEGVLKLRSHETLSCCIVYFFSILLIHKGVLNNLTK